MTDRLFHLLRGGSEADRAILNRRLQYAPQPRVSKSTIPLSGPQWMVEYGDSVAGAYSWDQAIEIAVAKHRSEAERRVKSFT